jgi:Holliday junction resolvase
MQDKTKSDKINVDKEKLEKLLHFNNFLDEDKIEEILVPRYNKWIKLYEFV